MQVGTTAQAADKAPVPAPTSVTAPDGTRLYARCWGDGPATLVFLAGWALPSEAWAYQMLSLSGQGFRCIAYDRRGHGRSDDPGRGYDYDTLAADLGAVLAAFDVRDATIIAHSMSGGEVVRFLSRGTADAAARIGRILFLATTLPCLMAKPDNPTGVPAAMFDGARKQMQADFPNWIDVNADPFVVPATSAGMRTWIKNIMMATTLRAVADLNKAMVEADFRPELSALSKPVLFIHGDRDASAPLPISAGPAAKLVRGARLTVYEGAPHGLFITHIERLNADIATFARS
ncbi:alpha/beta hydrolase (plasmid) [Niveispirillum cyanobacteriorum]|uniref:Alpha/beta hydrolase n=2 Tax=Niveispirillum cyanobacteriorum TaxID=1612173 RepID=A0A2K9NKL6_9PROT|nr:alpha/beta hydrolase [Niveispirillum cyanobacteriorum]GGE46679.1 arylesterase [Niveispirillum cyanobacteriorum]